MSGHLLGRDVTHRAHPDAQLGCGIHIDVVVSTREQRDDLQVRQPQQQVSVDRCVADE